MQGESAVDPNPPAAPGDASEVTAESNPPLSKKQQKKLAKAAWLAEKKKDRRAAEKERKKERKRVQAERRAAGELDEDEETAERERRSKRQKTDVGPKKPFNARVVVDLAFDEMMSENEVKSLTAQLAYTYSANRKSSAPFASLLFTSLDGRTKERMDGQGNAAYLRWNGAEWWEEGYERLWEGETGHSEVQPVNAEEAEIAGASGEKVKGEESGQPGAEANTKSGRRKEPSRAKKDTVVYLTADTDEELTELKEGETYILGGIVDRNRYKNLCFNKSKEQNIRSARLPIGTYLAEMPTRKVLTVNQTFEILLNWVETRDWKQSLYAVIPKRKFNTVGRRRGGKNIDETTNDDGEEGQEEGENEDGEEDGEVEVRVLDLAELEQDGEQ
ncbi:guanine-1-methyltransferase-domain-containing protein [Epithele typhae]|uniref:guanine-1-methyltransferase-domain-containing protein n=1 Tax=Epithele typhae TaxID=378194 RepID=UPI0020086FBD|nr:guanine-1-methyltransferase-domain-containing protein [Epithele typhae]KAH9939254.1 guanine-1-methyltransferase-domain-containing protein [Epithele typhae]